MTIFSRYVLFDLLKIFTVSLVALTSVMLLVGMFQNGSDHGLTPAQILQLFPFILPDALRYTVPATVLFAVSVVYGRMSGANEVVALKSMGISPMIVLWPAFILSFLLSLATVWLNDLAVSWGRAGVQRVVLESLEDIAYSMLRTQRSFNRSKFSIIVKEVDGRRLIQPTISIFSSSDKPQLTLTAEQAELRADTSTMTLSFICYNGSVDAGDAVSYSFDDLEYAVALEDASTTGSSNMPSAMAMRIIPDEIDKQNVKIAELDQELAAKAAFQMITGQITAGPTGHLTSVEWSTEASDRRNYREHLYRLQTEPHRRWSGGFACLCFAIVGAPVAIWRRNSDYISSFGACFLPILAAYYPLLAMSVNQAKHGDLPGYSVWLGNVVMLAAGLYFLKRVLRY